MIKRLRKVYMMFPAFLMKWELVTYLFTIAGVCMLKMDAAFEEKIENAIQQYYDLYKVRSIRLKLDIIRQYISQGMEPSEHVAFELFFKNKSEKHEFISLNEMRMRYYGDKANFFPRNKYERYKMFQNFFKRQLICITFDGTSQEAELYASFINKHDRFIVKPVNGAQGRAVQIVFSQEVPNLETLFERAGEACILEELIVQNEELAKFHPSSVNTVRVISTMNKNEECTILYSLFRCGIGNSVVDNTCAGGIASLIDVNKGIIKSNGFMGNKEIDCHPDTKEVFLGTCIPAWDEACKIAEKAHRMHPQQMLIGWDFAWTSEGWDLVEANPLPLMRTYQMIEKQGARPKLIKAGIL